MTEITEIQVRNLSPRELAEELRYSGDAGTAALAKHIIDHEIQSGDSEEEIEGLERDLNDATAERDTAQAEVDDLRDLLRECLTELNPNDHKELRDRIKAAL